MSKNILNKDNIKFVSEVGLNHLGSEKIAIRYCEFLASTQTDGVTFQVRENGFYDGSLSWKNELTKKCYIECADIVRDSGKSFPMKRVGRPKEIGDFVASIVRHDISYLSGVTINFDGGLSNHLF